MFRVFVIIIVWLFLAVGCGRHHDSRLERIWDTVSDTPRDALESLDSIEPSSLSESDRAFYNLLSIKAKDKAYIPHVSDSLILKVIAYYTRHQDADLYPEALYYGGRVYSDLGDYPTALRYFQDALDLLPEDTPNLTLRRNVLSQYGELLDDIGLHKHAIAPMEQVVEINQLLNDTLNLALDYKTLGVMYLHLNDYKNALINLERADKLTSLENNDDKIYKAAALYYKDDIKNALGLIRTHLVLTDTDTLNLALSYAAKIYLKANILDTAFRYGRQLTLSPRLDNKKAGYMVLLSPKLRQFIPKDSLEIYYRALQAALDSEFIHNKTNDALLHDSMYNDYSIYTYSVHDRLRRKVERHAQGINMIWLITLVGIIIIIIIIAFISYLVDIHKTKVIELQKTLAKLNVLEKLLSNKRLDENCDSNIRNMDSNEDIVPALLPLSYNTNDEKSLKIELRTKLKKLNIDATSNYKVPIHISESLPYLKLKSYLQKGDPIPSKDSVWLELEEIVLESFPNFKSSLQLLSDRDLNDDDLHIALLLKCGFSLRELGVFIGRTKGAVTYWRKKLSVRLFGEKLDLGLVDNIIRSL